jgi:ribonuclease HI
MAGSRKHYLVYADGSCIGNPGRGGWGAVIIEEGEGERREINGHDPATTNNRMEITAAIEALRHTDPGSAVVLRSDSQYVVHTMTKGWKRKANLDLWQRLDAEAARRRVQFEWVRGHGYDPLNDRADELANLGSDGKIVG